MLETLTVTLLLKVASALARYLKIRQNYSANMDMKGIIMYLKTLLAAAVLVISSTASVMAQPINGAGATFPNPLYQKWGEEAKKTGIQLNYQSVGSGAGQNQIRNRTVDFGASDAPMKQEDLEKNNLLQFPAAMGSLVAAVHVPGLERDQLRLTGQVLADIYLGKIVKWNDQRIVELNPTLRLPNLAIAVVYRADGSGTTYVWASYLSAVSEEWRSRVGTGTSVKWPIGTGARGNEGVSASVRQLRGAIGYVENAYAQQAGLVTTQIRNKDGHWVRPNHKAFEATAAAANWNVPNFAVNLIDQPGKDTWPIVSPTFILLPRDPKNPATSLTTMRFFDWAFSHGDEIAERLDYVPVPAEVKTRIRQVWASEVKAPDGTPVWK
jgi:phosphate transport system substrate-binding protein